MADTLIAAEVLIQEASPVAVFQGYDSVTGAGRSTAVQGQTQTVGGTSSVAYQVCEDISTLASSLNISQSLSVGFGPAFSFDEKMNFLRSIKVTTTSISIVVSARHVKGREVATNAGLAAGVKPPGGDPAAIRKFFRGYGDSYLSSVTHGGEYYAVYTFYSQTREEQQQVVTELKAHGLYNGVTVDASLQTKITNFTSSTKTRVGFEQTISGIQNPHLPKPSELVNFALAYPSLPLDAPAVITFETTGYERVPDFGSFGTLPANRRYFVGTGVVDGLAASLIAVQELINQINWLDQIYRFYGYSGDARIAAARGVAQNDLEAINAQMVEWEEDPINSFTKPPLPSLKLGVPALNYSIGYSQPDGGGGGDPFDDVNPATCIQNQWRIASLQMAAGKYVDRLLVAYESTQGKTHTKHGGEGGSGTNVLTLLPGVYLNEMDLRSGKYIDFIRFVLTDGNYLQAGGGGGSASKWTAPAGSVVLGFSGRSGKYLDQLRAVYGTLHEAKWQPRSS